MSKRTIALIAILSVITVLLIILAVKQNTLQTSNSTKQTDQQAERANKAVPMVSKAPQVAFSTLSFSPSPLTLSSASASVDVVVDSHGDKNKVTAVQLELSYDPQMITSVVVAPGSFFKNPLVFPFRSGKAGHVSFAVAIPPTGRGIAGKGVVAHITFQAKLSGGQNTKMELVSGTKIAAEGVVPSVLKGTTPLTITAKKPQ